MISIRLIVGISILLIPTFLKSQNFQSLGSGVNKAVTAIFTDSVTNKTYVGKNYMGPAYNGFNVWNGSMWDTLGFVLTTVRSINKFQGDMVVANGYLRKWNGTNWVDLATLPTFGGVLGVYNDNDNNLYVTGGFDTLNGIPASNIAKWDGTTWSAIDTSHWINISSCSIIYQGNLYIGGSFINYSGTIANIAEWDGTQWLSLNQINGGGGNVSCFEIYNNELYVAGNFSFAGGIPAQSIAKWNGTQWYNVGGGFRQGATIYDMQVFDGELYAAGIFDTVGGQPIEDIAKWDGTNWCGLGFSHVTSGRGVLGLAVLNNELYLGGGFLDIAGNTMNYVSKWAGGSFTSICGNTTAVYEIEGIEKINIYPNPSSNQITVEFDLAKQDLVLFEIRNVLGQIVYSSHNQMPQGKQKLEVDVSSFTNGIYFLQMQNGINQSSIKFIKQ